VFCEVQQNKQQLPTYKEFKSKFLKKDLFLSSKDQENENQGIEALVA
jgi:hypothetical protein